jgi:hypothetical protein
MNTNTKRVLYWIPRVLTILFALFISIFALDVFGEGYNVGETILALLIHLVPTFIVIIALVIAWRWERIGAILFITLAILFWGMSRGEGWIIAVPLFLLGVLFLFDWMYRAQLKTQ